MTSISLNTVIPLPHAPEPDQLLLYDQRGWRICNALEFSLASNKQQQLQVTATELKKIALAQLQARKNPHQGNTSSFEISELYPLLVDRGMRSQYFSANRLSFKCFTAQHIAALFELLQRQATNTLGQWDHSALDAKVVDGEMRKLIDCITAFGENLFLRANVAVWGKRMFEVQSYVARCPSNFFGGAEIDFCPREVRSLDWLATVCAYILADYLRVNPSPDPHFGVFNEALDRCVMYRVAERFDLVGGLWAFGLLPVEEQEAPPIVLIRGTEKNPLKEGFWGSWWLNSDPNFPGASLCTSQTSLEGHKKLINWMTQQCDATKQKLHLVGHSLGGTISVALALYKSELVAKAIVFNAPLFKKMAVQYAKIANPPEILQFLNSNDPLCQFDGTLIGRAYHLDFLESGNSRSKPREYWKSIAHLLPPHLIAPQGNVARIASKIAHCALNVMRVFARFPLVRVLLSIEPLPTLGEFLRKLKGFPDSIYQHHSIPSTLKRRCLVQKCTSSDMGRSDLIALRLVFEWMCRTWAFLIFTTALNTRQWSQSALATKCRATLVGLPALVAHIARRSPTLAGA